MLASFITFVFIQVIYETDNRGLCDWTGSYNPNNVFRCTREQAACNVVRYFTRPATGSELRGLFNTKGAYGEMQTARHLMAPLFVASVLFCGVAVVKLFVEKRESRFVESADERVARLEGQAE